MRRFFRGAALTLPLIAIMALAACGDQDAEQRKAFIGFLQTRIIDQPGLRVPQLTVEERKAFGPYADHYGVITDFHKVMNETVSPKFAAALAKGAIQSPADLITRKDDLKIAKTTLGEMNAALADDLAQADAAHRNLVQPADVKAAFDKAYDRVVTTAATTFREVAPVADKVFADALDVGGYIDQHKDSVKIVGTTLQVSDAATRTALNAKLQALQGSQQAVNAAQAKFRELVYGSGR